MIFNEHSKLIGKHAFLSASNYHWINYDLNKLQESYLRSMAIQRGTELHAFAAEAIRLGINLPRSKTTLNMYVNDAIGYRMTPEQILYYSDNCFGTADSISFSKNHLRIHDLKTGVTQASMNQLKIYAALFCLEYGHSPEKITMELRIYQNNEIIVEEPYPMEVGDIMKLIIEFDAHIERLKKGG